jgi:predicted nucleotidyltransferase
LVLRAGTATGAMERDLHARDRVGVQDFVLLENFQSEDAFVENLRKRFKENLIYVSNRCPRTVSETEIA